MEDQDVLAETLHADGVEVTPERIQRLDADLTLFAQILSDYFIYQKRLGKKTSDPYFDDEQSYERSHLLPGINKRTSGGN